MLGLGLGLWGNAAATGGAPDTTAPTLSSPVGTQTGATTATIGATTDEGNGTMYGVVTTSSTAPTAVQVESGQNNLGSAAVFAGSVAVSSTGAKTINATGLTASTAYYAHIMHKDAAGNRSSVVSSAQFTTAASDVALVATNGTDKHANVTLSNGNLTAVGASTTTGTFWGDRADTTKTGKRQFEITVGSGWIDPYVIYFGIDDGSANFGTATSAPSVGVYGKLTYVTGTTTNFKAFYNGANADSVTTSIVAGDKIALEYDTVGGSGNFYLTHSGTTTLLSGPLNGMSASTFNKAYIGVEGAANVTVNFGATSFSHPLSSGYSAYST